MSDAQQDPYAGNPYAAPPQPMSPQDEKVWATLTHVGGIVLGFIAPLVAYLVLRERGPFIREHAAAALNFQLTLLIAYVVGWVLSIVFIGVLLLLAAWVVSIVFAIVASLAANRGEYYRYPATITFVQ
jgi:uncharacterized protein